MATTMAGRYCTGSLAQVISGFRRLQIIQTQPPCLALVQRSIWSSLFNPSSKQPFSNSTSAFPQKPKRPANMFVVYLMKVGPQVKQANPDASRIEIVKHVSQMWRELDPEEKSRYAMERKDLMDRYKSDMETYMENITPEQIKAEEKIKQQKRARRLKRARRSLGKPKRPYGAFNCFVSEKFGERQGEQVSAYFKKVAEMWASMSQAEKKVYEERAEELKIQYQKDMTKWENDMIALGRFDVIRKTAIDQLRKKKKTEKKKGAKSSSTADEDEL